MGNRQWRGSDVRNALDKRGATEQDIWRYSSSLKVQRLRMSEFDHLWTVDRFWLDDSGQRCSLSDVANNRKRCSEHWKQIVDADMSYPIVIALRPDGSWDIVDGLHRFMKAKVLLNEQKINARVMTLASLK